VIAAQKCTITVQRHDSYNRGVKICDHSLRICKCNHRANFRNYHEGNELSSGQTAQNGLSWAYRAEGTYNRALWLINFLFKVSTPNSLYVSVLATYLLVFLDFFGSGEANLKILSVFYNLDICLVLDIAAPFRTKLWWSFC
jgi:hypothetical protein